MGTGSDDDSSTQVSNRDFIRAAASAQFPSLVVIAGGQIGETFRIETDEMVIGRDPNADIQVLDDTISRKHALIRKTNTGFQVEDLGSKNGTFVNRQPISLATLSNGDKLQLGSTTILKFGYHDELDENFFRQMYESALRDSLTKAFNKRYFLARLENEFRFAVRHSSPLSVLLFDIDLFKSVNDNHGHIVGDQVLAQVGMRVHETIRVEDVFARYGGEEFAVICRSVPPANAFLLAERIRKRIVEEAFVCENVRLAITVSVGVAGLPDTPAVDPAALVAAADGVLYRAKRDGRNRSVLARPPAGISPVFPRPAPGPAQFESGRTTRKLTVPSEEVLREIHARANRAGSTTIAPPSGTDGGSKK